MESRETNVFLDLGTHYFEGLKEFVSNILPIDESWEIHAFEPSPSIDLQKTLEDSTLDRLNITTHNKAVWIRDEDLTFKLYGQEGLSQGSLLEETKGDFYYRDYHSSAIVRGIDLYKFLENLKDKSNIYIKMDIEWSEYAVLENLLERGWPTNIRKIWVEFHGTNEETHKNKSQLLIERIRRETATEVASWI